MVRIFFFILAAVLTGCTMASPELMSDVRDPYESTNRKIFKANLMVDDYVLEPAAKGYRALPEGAQAGITNFAKWSTYPSTAVNSTLQGKFENAAVASIHFLVNGLTLGLADLTEDDVNVETEDFGQTMAVWHIPQGAYMMLPLLGPGAIRSHTGNLVDNFTNPLGFIGGQTVNGIRLAATPSNIIATRGNNYEHINNIKYNAIDLYAKTRSLYFQYRNGQIAALNSALPSDSDKAFSDFSIDEY